MNFEVQVVLFVCSFVDLCVLLSMGKCYGRAVVTNEHVEIYTHYVSRCMSSYTPFLKMVSKHSSSHGWLTDDGGRSLYLEDRRWNPLDVEQSSSVKRLTTLNRAFYSPLAPSSRQEAYPDRRWNANKVPTPTGNFTVPHSVNSVTLNDTTLGHEGAKTQVELLQVYGDQQHAVVLRP